jgi:nitroimidazol reductase NimA-like FMN-containing flavoprotein (pyridoxamine 5'-phosphate oxidase superfamily)
MEATMKWTKAEKDFVDPLRVARLATVGKDGIPHNVPICPLLYEGKIYVGTEARAKKVRNILANPHVAIVFDDYTEAWGHLRGVMIQGGARVVGPAEFRRLRKRLYSKYDLYESQAPLTDGDTAILEILPAKKFSWGL